MIRRTETTSEGSPGETPDYEAFLHRLADLASAKILPHFRAQPDVVSKERDRFDPVTVADRAAEEAIRAEVEATFPADGLLGEEFGASRMDAERVWVVDPIDGTRSFICGVPVWGVLIGLLTGGRPDLGLMAQPFIGERYFGDGASATYRGPGGPRPLKVRPCRDIADAVLFTTSLQDFAGEAERDAYLAVERLAKLTRYGTDCYAYCMLAAGTVDAVIESGLNAYDILPLVPIIEGAGGIVTDWHGNPPPDTGQVVATGDPRLHDRILSILSRG
jgi:histidinol phosphatase-like enzyme (inositol monophosphatase family)